MRTWRSPETGSDAARPVANATGRYGEATLRGPSAGFDADLIAKEESRRAERIRQRGFANIRPSPEVESRYTGLLRPVQSADSCLVTVIVDDVGEAVRAAGGWMCDRIRAGWRVAALVAIGQDVTPLQVLGIQPTTIDVESDCVLLAPRPATLAFGAGVLSWGLPVSAQIQACMRNSAVEVTVWGEGDIAAKQRFHDVRHRLSPAARSFKKFAMRAAAVPESGTDFEALRSCAPWYPLDQVVDLNTVVGGGMS